MLVSELPLARNLTELLGFFNYARQYPDFPKDVNAFLAGLDGSDPYNGDTPFYLAIVTIFLALIAVTARLYTRAFVTAHRLGPDDWAIIPATFAAIAFTFIEIWVIKHGQVGHHTYLLPADTIFYGFQFQNIGFLTKMISATLIKISICLFIFRLCLPNDRVGRWLVTGSLVLVIVTEVVSCLQTTFECRPVVATWDLRLRVFGSYQCENVSRYLVMWAAIYAVEDVWLLILPWRFLWALKLPRRRKYGLAAIFSIGGVASIFAFLKMHSIPRAYNSWDPHWGFREVLIFSQLELTLGLIAASLPALGFLLIRIVPAISSVRRRSGSSTLARSWWSKLFSKVTFRETRDTKQQDIEGAITDGQKSFKEEGGTLTSKEVSRWTQPREMTWSPHIEKLVTVEYKSEPAKRPLNKNSLFQRYSGLEPTSQQRESAWPAREKGSIQSEDTISSSSLSLVIQTPPPSRGNPTAGPHLS